MSLYQPRGSMMAVGREYASHPIRPLALASAPFLCARRLSPPTTDPPLWPLPCVDHKLAATFGAHTIHQLCHLELLQAACRLKMSSFEHLSTGVLLRAVPTHTTTTTIRSNAQPAGAHGRLWWQHRRPRAGIKANKEVFDLRATHRRNCLRHHRAGCCC